MIREMLQDEKIEVRERAVKMWQDLHAKNFHQGTEGYRIAGEQKKEILKHMQAMADAGDAPKGVSDDRYRMALEAG